MKVNFLFFIFLFLSFTGCGGNQSPQPLYDQPTCSGFAGNALNQQMYWGSSFPIKLYMDQSVPDQFHEAISNAANTWNHSFNFKIFDVVGVIPQKSAPGEDGKNIIYWMTTWDGSSKLEASTLLHWKASSIYEADMLLNAKDFRFSAEPNDNELDLESIVLHEMGHILGLGHIDNPSSIMQPQLKFGVKRRIISQPDINHIKCQYK